MSDDTAELLLKASLKAEACRRLADRAENEYRKALWIERALYWDQLAAEAMRRRQREKPPDA
jgi:hypothetical protein